MNLEYIRNLSRLGIEVWEDIPDFKGYQASNLGNVRSFIHKKNGTNLNTHTNPKQLKKLIRIIRKNKKRYYVNLYKNRKLFSKNIAPLVAMAFLKHKPNGHRIVVDHIDNNSLNDKLYNLQLISNRLNIHKDFVNPTSKYIGVTWHKASKKWSAQISINNKKKWLGCYITEFEAANAYKKALKEYETKEIHYNTKNKKIREYSKPNLYEC